VGRAGEPVSVLNLDAPQPIGAIVTELLHSSQEALWAIALLPTAFGKSTADGASGIQMERAGLRPSLSPYLYFIQLTIAVFVVEQARKAYDIVSGCMGTIESRSIIPDSPTDDSQRTTPHPERCNRN
jgi:hypothetical protein